MTRVRVRATRPTLAQRVAALEAGGREDANHNVSVSARIEALNHRAANAERRLSGIDGVLESHRARLAYLERPWWRRIWPGRRP